MKLQQRLQKRLAIAAVTATIFSTVGAPVFAADYDTHWAAPAISEWKDKGIINGYEDGSFRPKQNITRAELATIITNVFGLTETKGAKSFEDVQEGAWYAEAIAKVSAAGIMYTEGNTFKPNTPATREEAAYALAKAYKLSGSTNKTFKDSADISSWSQDAIASLVSGGYIHGRPDGTFAPKDQLTRADLVTMIDKVTADLYNQAGTYTKDVEGNLVVSAPDVILKGMTIHGNLYIAQGVGNGDVTLEDVNVTGEVFVEGGGLNSIKLNGKTKISQVTVNKPDGNVRLVTSGEATVGQVTAQSGVALEGKFTEIVVSNKVEINVLGQSTIGSIKVEKSAEGVTLKLSADTTIQHVSLDAKANITGKGKIEKLSLADNISKSDLKIEATVKETVGGKDTADKKPSGSGGSSSSGGSGAETPDSGNEQPGVVKYQITTSSGLGYQIKVNGDLEQKADEIVTFEVKTTSGYVVKKVTVDRKECTAVNGVYSFRMPKSDVKIEVEVERESQSSNPGNNKPQIRVHNGTGYRIEIIKGDLNNPVVGEDIIFEVKLDPNYTLAKVSINDDITLSPASFANGYTFKMPNKPVDIRAEVIGWDVKSDVVCDTLEKAVNSITSTSAYYLDKECDIKWSVNLSGGDDSLTTNITTTGVYEVIATVTTKGPDSKEVGEGAFDVTIEYDNSTKKYTLTMKSKS